VWVPLGPHLPPGTSAVSGMTCPALTCASGSHRDASASRPIEALGDEGLAVTSPMGTFVK